MIISVLVDKIHNNRVQTELFRYIVIIIIVSVNFRVLELYGLIYNDISHLLKKKMNFWLL
jgi:hypothetical protein